LTISGTHWLMPNAGRLAKDGNTYVFSPEAGAGAHLVVDAERDAVGIAQTKFRPGSRFSSGRCGRAAAPARSAPR
jgi:hypothetical protein